MPATVIDGRENKDQQENVPFPRDNILCGFDRNDM